VLWTAVTVKYITSPLIFLISGLSIDTKVALTQNIELIQLTSTHLQSLRAAMGQHKLFGLVLLQCYLILPLSLCAIGEIFRRVAAQIGVKPSDAVVEGSVDSCRSWNIA
jgi:hypothetical protein